jgi:hypothetical protein
LNHFTVPSVIGSSFRLREFARCVATTLSRGLFKIEFLQKFISPTLSARRGQIVSAEARW